MYRTFIYGLLGGMTFANTMIYRGDELMERPFTHTGKSLIFGLAWPVFVPYLIYQENQDKIKSG